MLANLGALLSVFGAATMFGNRNRSLGMAGGIFFIALAIFLFVYVGRILTDKLAESGQIKISEQSLVLLISMYALIPRSMTVLQLLILHLQRNMHLTKRADSLKESNLTPFLF